MENDLVLTCDTCGETIEKLNMALLEWSADEADGYLYYGFKLVHKGECDPDDEGGSLELDTVTGLEGKERLLAFLSPGPLIVGNPRNRVRDLDEFVDMFRRLHTPGYDQARKHFGGRYVHEAFSGANEVFPYTQRSLAGIIENAPDYE